MEIYELFSRAKAKGYRVEIRESQLDDDIIVIIFYFDNKKRINRAVSFLELSNRRMMEKVVNDMEKWLKAEGSKDDSRND